MCSMWKYLIKIERTRTSTEIPFSFFYWRIYFVREFYTIEASNKNDRVKWTDDTDAFSTKKTCTMLTIPSYFSRYIFFSIAFTFIRIGV